eukprot:jgi/Tetstr1/440329/TSEL_028666.t1
MRRLPVLLGLVLGALLARGGSAFLGGTTGGRLVAQSGGVRRPRRQEAAQVGALSVADFLPQVDDVLASGDNVSRHLQDWSRAADAVLPQHLWEQSYRVIPWPLPDGGAYSHAGSLASGDQATTHQETSIYRLNPRHNAVISVSTSNVSQGECDTCYVGITATVYRESWEWVVGAGDVLVDGSGVLSDDVLVEAGATYFIVLRQENIKRRLATETGVEAQAASWEHIIGGSKERHDYALSVTYRDALHDWATAIEGLPFREEVLSMRHSVGPLMKWECDGSRPMHARRSQDSWHRVIPQSNISVVVRSSLKASRSGTLCAMEEASQNNGLIPLVCDTLRSGQVDLMVTLRMQANSTYYIALEGLMDSEDGGGSLAMEAVHEDVQSGLTSEILMHLMNGKASELETLLAPPHDYMEICSLPYIGPPISNAASFNLIEPHRCGHSNGGREIWYRFQPASALLVHAKVVSEAGPGGEAYLTVLYVVESMPDGSLRQISCGNDSVSGMGSVIPSVQLLPNRTYFFIVDGYLDHSMGVHALELQPATTAPGSSASLTASCAAQSLERPAMLSSGAVRSERFQTCASAPRQHGTARGARAVSAEVVAEIVGSATSNTLHVVSRNWTEPSRNKPTM